MTAEDEDQSPPDGDGDIDGAGASRDVFDRLADVTEVSDVPDASTVDADQPSEIDDGVSLAAFYEALESEGRPVVTAQQVARRLGVSQADAMDGLGALAGAGRVQRVNVETDPVVWYPTEWGDLASRERVVLFPKRREIVVDNPTQYTRARLSQFAHLADTTGDRGDRGRGYLYRIRREDVWQAPFDDVDSLLSMLRSVLPERSPHLEAWVEDQWKRAHQFRLYSHEEGYTVLEAATESLMGNVALQKLDDDHVYAPISDTEAWVRDEEIAAIKRILYDAGYPVEDDRDLEEGEELDVTLGVDLRDYQRDWVDRFVDQRAGVLVGPPGAGKTIAGIGALAAVGGETLILVPSRELARQWREELRSTTDLDADQIGEYHGGAKEIRPVTIATYQTAGMDRHRSLFDSRRWGLIIYDEAHHIPSRVFQRSADLQSKHRLGLSATPIREDDKEAEIFTLIGPPIGTDWGKLFDAGYVQEPEVEIRYVGWGDDMARNEWASSDGRERHMLAAMNPGKIFEIRRLRARHADSKALVFVDYLDQGEAIAEALGVPFVSGETRHHRREAYFEAFRDGDLDTLVISRIGDEGIDLPNAGLAIVASGLGGSRRQGSQRAGRTMRPTGSALVYVLATRGTSEEDFAQRQMQHLAGKGIRVRETSADDLDTESDGGDTDADTDADTDTEDDESDGAESASADGAESATTDE
ncbi:MULTISPECIES: DEAD/DEAH box helicase [unclassified Haloferax]|uniref:DEAD/DEAH box helicase n=1 Tax=unclassified Haloferax TaxID=2625095 RepID=UPI0002B1D7AB|nr:MULTISPECIES: DEAD/DEAH box helicase [unclassified Haloferax]ELZ62191.1 DNA repair helicase Rad25 [Haloferax sp. ATCC BAA-646]ELZ65719.1 DNA repair helicase Rad25 [Haloferax sp. ATCC BAA-645]ELZ68930.1 DNA repair helicase Rad25 [Haloferax sp. ATCC BAA-644]